MNNNARITLRMDAQELDEIDDFLLRSLKFGSRSEFIRHAIMTYVDKSNKGLLSEEGIKIQLDNRFMNITDDLIKSGLFKDMDDAINHILRQNISEGYLSKIIQSLMVGYIGLLKDIDSFNNDSNLKNAPLSSSDMNR